MYGLYNSFNFLTGYKEVNPSVQSIEWRLIVLESVAGVPGFVAAGKKLSLLHLKRRKKSIVSTITDASLLIFQVSDIFVH